MLLGKAVPVLAFRAIPIVTVTTLFALNPLITYLIVFIALIIIVTRSYKFALMSP